VKSFFAHMNLARLIILLSIIGSSYLAWANWGRYQDVKFLRGTFLRQVPAICKEIQEHALLNTELSKDIKGDLYIKEASLESYVRRCAESRSAEIGEVGTNPTSRPERGGVIDNQIIITPDDRKRTYSHSQIAAFFYRLEADSNQIKVTDLLFQLNEKSIKPEDIPPDAWTFKATITNRVKDQSRAAGPNTARF
jgi:hypothetical protein